MPHWPQFQTHLACNLWVQCQGGQDEDQCNYTRCDFSGFVVNDKCYTLSRESTQSAVEAQEKCAAMGAALATIPTVSVRDKITAITSRKTNHKFYIGLHSDVPGLPSMYGKDYFQCNLHHACILFKIS